jgi:ABC-type transport system involved in cytochrome c biogenesis permease subunit
VTPANAAPAVQQEKNKQMAIDTLSRLDASPLNSPADSVQDSLKEAVLFLFRPWASLRLTVALFALAILLIFIGTLAQVTMDMWEVISLYFRAWFSWIDVKVLFPVSWFPNLPEQAMRTIIGMGFLVGGLALAIRCAVWRSGTWDWRIALGCAALLLFFQTSLVVRHGAFWFPGGATIGTLLALNLLAAHLVRFKIQARGLRLLVGLVGVAVGAVTTWVVISSGHNPDGLQAVPVFSWTALWLWCKLALTGLALLNLGMLAVVWARASRRIIELVLLGLSAVVLTILSVWLWLAGDGAYLGDAGMRILWQLIQGGLAAAVVLAACILLFKRRGGIVLIHAGLALLMVGEWFVSWYAVEERLVIREGESANFALDIRETELAVVNPDYSPTEEDVVGIPRSQLLRSLQRNEPIRHPNLPFDIHVTQYLKNSDLRRPRADEQNPATAGVGLSWLAEEMRPGSGADSNSQVDMASAYVTLTEKDSDKPIGTYLVSQLLASPQFSERVSVAGKTYDLALRFKHTYKPYTMHLIDVRKDDYIGTSTPKNYSSDVHLVDAARNVDRKVRIWMNNPLRYAGETFYQSGYNEDPRTGVETTTLQVVTNTGWMIPYVACMFVWFGMQSHFSGMLLRFLTRRDEELLASRDQDVVPASLVTPVKEPEGRRGRRRRQRAEEQEPRGKSRSGGVIFPAAVVLIFGSWLASQARPPRVANDDFDLAAFAKLPIVDQGRVKPIDTLARTTLAKVSDRETYRDPDGNKQPAVRWFLDIVAKPSAAEQHEVFRIQNLDVLQMLGLERRKGFRYSLEELRSDPTRLAEFDKELRATRQVDVAKMDVYQRKLIELNNRFQAYMRLLNAFQPWDLPPFPTDKEMAADRDAALRGWIARVMSGGDQAEREMASMQAPLAVPQLPDSGQQADSQELASQAAKPWQPYSTAYNRAYLQNMLGQPGDPAALAWHAIFEAYRTGDAKTFNREVDSFRQRLAATPPHEYVPRKVGLEAYMSSFGPFTFCIGLYWTAFVLAACAWLGWSRPLNRAAFWLLFLAFLVHTAALVGRMYISGRPPVTNLYSSAVFIGWAFAVAGLALEAIFRLGVCNVVAAVGGALALMIAQALGQGADTYTVMQAVLDTQFWLATHVVIIALGYAATFMAGLFGIIYIAMGVFTTSLSAPETRKLLSRMIYGVICFAALFSFVGTVLGGLWADDSWGRFWGWDPKENGALIIVLWNALILHALWGKMVRERGLAILAVAGNIVTAWSWFGVNELGVGLHSYGFTEGVLLTLGLFVASQLAIMMAGSLPLSWWGSFRNSSQAVL